jgi:hypothetical protein
MASVYGFAMLWIISADAEQREGLGTLASHFCIKCEDRLRSRV